MHDIARRDFFDIDDAPRAAANDRRLDAQRFAQRGGACLRAPFLQGADENIDGDDGADESAIRKLAQQESDRRCGEENVNQRIVELPQNDDKPRRPRRFRQAVGAVQLKPTACFGFGKALDIGVQRGERGIDGQGVTGKRLFQGETSFGVVKSRSLGRSCRSSYRAYMKHVHFRRCVKQRLESKETQTRKVVAMKLPKRTTWFLVLDRAKARLFESTGPHGEWSVTEEWSDEDARTPSRDLGRDRPPRGRTIGTGEPFAIEGQSEQDKAGEAFLAARARDLAEAAKGERFDQLVIAAAPAALGFLRKKLHPDVTAKMIGAYDKDLTNLADHELRDYFTEKLEHW